MGEEKRKYLRFECLVPVEFIRVEGQEVDERRREACLDEISREGIRLVMDVDLNFPPGAEIDFKVNLPERRLTSKVLGEVMWVRPKGDRYELGIRIKRMDTAIKSEIMDLAYDQWRESAEDKDRKT